MHNALFYLTYNGLYNFTNGIGTQTQLLLGGMEQLRDSLTTAHGPIDLHIVCPEPDAETWGYDPVFFAHQQQRISALGGQIHLVPFKTEAHQELWDIRSWQTLCQTAAPMLHTQTANYDRSIIIAVDQPWLQVPRYLHSEGRSTQPQIDTLLVLYNTAYIRNWDEPDVEELAWEQEGLDASKPGSHIAIAAVCPSFTTHLRTHFGLPRAQFVPYTSSILVNDPVFALRPTADVRERIEAHGVPLDQNLVLAFGRATPIKGFESLMPALEPLRDQIHLVLISVPYLTDDSMQRVYDDLLHQHRISATHIKHFTRELPEALCQWPRTKMVAAPSRHETFSNIPLEVALWARQGGPVSVTSTAGGFVDQIEPGVNGFFMDTASPQAMTKTFEDVLNLSDDAHAAIRTRAYERVVNLYDFARNFPQTLNWFWPST